MFYTPYTANQRIYRPNKSGTNTYHCWELVCLPNGTKSFVKGADKPLYDRIQSFANETDIKLIISRCIQRDGDLSALMADKTRSIDLRLFPSNVKEYQTFVNSVKNAFESLPISLKGKFSSFDEFSKNPDMLATLFNEIVAQKENLADNAENKE